MDYGEKANVVNQKKQKKEKVAYLKRHKSI